MVFRLRQNSFGDILCRRDIGTQGRFRTIVRLRRHHTAYMQHDVRAGHTFQYIFVLRQVAPNNMEHRMFRHYWRKQFLILLARTS